MTNYPRDEFDRVPEFSNRSGSHRENGWAAAASVGGTRSGLRWLMVFGALALVVGLFSFTVLPKFTGASNEPAPVAASSSSAGQSPEVPSETPAETDSPQASDSAEPTESTEPADSTESTQSIGTTEASASGLPEDVDTTMAVGVYNGAKRGGLAGTARTELLNAGFSNVSASNWTKKVTYSTVYYRSAAYKATAEAAAGELGITSVVRTANIPGNIAVVLGSNYQ